MATFFGEVLPVFSRAVDDEDDDETDVAEFCSPELKWNADVKGLVEQIEAGNRLSCSTLVVAVGSAASCFTQVYLMGGEFETLAVITSGFSEKSNTKFDRQTLMEKKCHLYRSARSPSQLVCVCNSPVAPEQAFSWTAQLFEHLDVSSSQICVLTSSAASDFLSDTPPSARSVPFLRALTTCAWEGAPVCPYLEQPNVVNGLPAQILTHLHINKVKAVLYTCFTDTIFLDSRTIKAFTPILKSPMFKDTVQSNPEADEMLKKIATLQSSNTLYL